MLNLPVSTKGLSQIFGDAGKALGKDNIKKFAKGAVGGAEALRAGIDKVQNAKNALKEQFEAKKAAKLAKKEDNHI